MITKELTKKEYKEGAGFLSHLMDEVLPNFKGSKKEAILDFLEAAATLIENKVDGK